MNKPAAPLFDPPKEETVYQRCHRLADQISEYECGGATLLELTEIKNTLIDAAAKLSKLDV